MKTAAVVATSCLWLASTALAAGVAPFGERPRQAASDGDDAGAALLARMCSRCHDSARIVESRRTRSDWQDILLKMIEKGAEGSDKDFEALFTYLCSTYGQIYINQAGAAEIVAVLGVTSDEADAIAKYRAAKGNFADFAALLKVPNVNQPALQKHRAAFVF
jgi:mono/diheme cytochrome c family protein